mgnify:CR=1 FL=1
MCGSIAAYKSAFLVRLLVKAGAEVRVVVTDDAKDFISPLTLGTLSKNPVLSQFVQDQNAGTWTNHVELGLWADVLVIAPATGNTLAKMTNGQCDNLLTATYLSARCPVFFAPAMDLDMWAHPATQKNVQKLQSYGNRLISVGDGELASGLEGKGRMAEPEEILEELTDYFQKKKPTSSSDYAGKKVLITAGPTREDIDPIRFITNHSTGTMGVEIANAFAEAGAQVSLVLGPTSKSFLFHHHVDVIRVVSAEEMFNAVDEHFSASDITIMAAAVSDYKPTLQHAEKLKKKEGDLHLNLSRTVDILKTMGERKKPHQLLIGFALETQNEIENAKKKVASKNLDFIILNSLRVQGAGFKHSTNQVTIIDKYNNITIFELKNKADVAVDILNHIKSYPHAQVV